MVTLDLYVAGRKCSSCDKVKRFVRSKNLPVSVKVDGYHPLVNNQPTLIIDDASAIIGADSILSFLNTYFVKKGK